MFCLILSVICAVYLPEKSPTQFQSILAGFYVFISFLTFGIAAYTPLQIRNLMNEQLKYRF